MIDNPIDRLGSIYLQNSTWQTHSESQSKGTGEVGRGHLSTLRSPNSTSGLGNISANEHTSENKHNLTSDHRTS